MRTMKSSNENDTSILKLPYQKVDLDRDVTDDELMFQLRITLTEFLNKVRLGQRYITPEITDAIQHHNEMARKHGYTPIEYDN